MLWPPARGTFKADVRDALAVADDVIDAARNRQRSDEGVPGVGDMNRRAKQRVRARCRSWTVQESEPQNDAAPPGRREPGGLALGCERRLEVARNVPKRRVLVDFGFPLEKRR
jgi:hypothetical protein